MKWLWTIIVSILLVGAGFGTMKFMMATKPKADRARKESLATPVDIIAAELISEKVNVSGFGTVIPSRELELSPEITGRIVSMNPNLVPGGVFKAGAEILKIDDGDYQAALKVRQSQLADAEYALKVELGQQVIAKKEWELLENEMGSSEIGKELALREPHLAKARAAEESARKAVERAQWELDRAKIVAPFNCVVKDKYVEKDQRITTQNKIADLIGTDSFWVKVSIPVSKLEWINLPDENGKGGSSATVRLESSQGTILEKTGTVVRVLPDLDPEGRMARLLVEVADPLGLKQNGGRTVPLSLGSYVTVEITGKDITQVVEVPSSAVHEGDVIHIVTDDGKLDVREVQIAWRKTDSVLIRNDLRGGERIVVSRIPVPVPGMALRIAESREDGGKTGNTETPNEEAMTGQQ